MSDESKDGWPLGQRSVGLDHDKSQMGNIPLGIYLLRTVPCQIFSFLLKFFFSSEIYLDYPNWKIAQNYKCWRIDR